MAPSPFAQLPPLDPGVLHLDNGSFGACPRAALGAFVGAAADDLAFVPSATSAVNALLRSLTRAPGDERLTADHACGACRAARGVGPVPP